VSPCPSIREEEERAGVGLFLVAMCKDSCAGELLPKHFF
jgi:hypothetical protein